MANQASTVSPSLEARSLFNQMVSTADERAHGVYHLNLTDTVQLCVQRADEGQHDHEVVDELQSAGWIRPALDGGWVLG